MKPIPTEHEYMVTNVQAAAHGRPSAPSGKSRRTDNLGSGSGSSDDFSQVNRVSRFIVRSCCFHLLTCVSFRLLLIIKLVGVSGKRGVEHVPSSQSFDARGEALLAVVWQVVHFLDFSVRASCGTEAIPDFSSEGSHF